MKADHDLNSQQKHLSATSYDLRITNLARFIYSKIHNSIDSIDRKVKFLDVGAGNGLFLKFFKAKGFEVAGFDLENQNVVNMIKDPELKNERISQGDITKLKGNQEYDIVLASDVIEHIKDDVLAIKNLWSFVKPGGMMLITVPAHSYLYGKRDEKWGHHRRYDLGMLKEHIYSAIKKGYTIEFLTQWNIVGFYLYFLFEKILHKPINENMRYSSSRVSRSVRTILDKILQLEEMIGGLPLGLTLIVGVRKTVNNTR